MTKFYFWLLLLAWTSLAQSRDLQCKDIHPIQLSYLKNHILFSKYGDKLQERVVDEFISLLDSEKIYFLKSDIKKIKKQNKNLFNDLKKSNCNNLYAIYNLYTQRVQERIQYANSVLNKNFYIKSRETYVIDSKKKEHPLNLHMAKRSMDSYLQYQVANVFMIEEDLNKSIKYVSINLDNFQKRIKIWKPILAPKEARACKKNNEQKNFKTCKPYKWLSMYLNSFAHSLDSHSSYLDSKDLEEFKISMELSLEGIGASLSSRFGYIVIEKLTPGGAVAQSQSLKPKDKILAVGQKRNHMVDTFGLDLQDAVSMIRGKKNTVVYLKILREEKDKKKKVFTVAIRRKTIDLKEEEAAVYYINKKIKNKTGQVALIKVPSFYGSGSLSQKSITYDIKNILKHPKTARSDAVVLDLSNNRGGSLEEAVNLTGLFFSKGNVVKQSEKYVRVKNYTTLSDADSRILYTGSLVILVNRLSASASEIVSGTLQNYKRALVVGGNHTFGKGSVQSVEYLRNQAGAIKTTVGLYFIPSGNSTQKKGVVSDIIFPSILDIDEIGEKSLDFTLPHQKIASFKSYLPEIFSTNPKTKWKEISPKIISKIRKLSSIRIKKNKKFHKIKQKIAKYNRKKNKYSIRISEILDKTEDEKKEGEDLLNLSAKEKKKKYLERADIEEAIFIALDLSSIQN